MHVSAKLHFRQRLWISLCCYQHYNLLQSKQEVSNRCLVNNKQAVPYLCDSDKVLRELSLVPVDAVRLAPPTWTPQVL